MSITNNDVIIAALHVAGPKPKAPVRGGSTPEEYTHALEAYAAEVVAHDQSFKAAAREIKVMLTEQSPISKQLIALDKALDPNSGDGKIFIGTIVSVTKETKTTRAILTLHTGTDREAKDSNNVPLPIGQEQLRTERTDNPDGRFMARTAQLLIGHRVTVYVELEAIRGGATKVRVLRHVEDGGVDAKYDAATGQVAA